MSELRYLNSGPDLVGKDLSFPDLYSRLAIQLDTSRSLPDLEILIQTLNGLLRSEKYSRDQVNLFRRLRQRAYDRRRNQKMSGIHQDLEGESMAPKSLVIFPKLESLPVSGTVISPIQLETISQVAVQPKIKPKTLTENEMTNQQLTSNNPNLTPNSKEAQFTQQECIMPIGIFTNIDWSEVVKSLPKTVILLGAALAANWLLWLQSVGLYKASGFTSPELIAFGGVLMVVGFAAYHSVYRSKLALLLCIYACAYETYFIASGTVADERQVKSEALLTGTQESHWHEEQVVRAQAEYERQKARFDNPNDKEYQSQWFKKSFVDSSWVIYSKAQQEHRQFLAHVESAKVFDHTGWLKIFYRLGLVFLCMLLAHRFAVVSLGGSGKISSGPLCQKE